MARFIADTSIAAAVMIVVAGWGMALGCAASPDSVSARTSLGSAGRGVAATGGARPV